MSQTRPLVPTYANAGPRLSPGPSRTKILAQPIRMEDIINNSINTRGPQQLRGILSLIP